MVTTLILEETAKHVFQNTNIVSKKPKKDSNYSHHLLNEHLFNSQFLILHQESKCDKLKTVDINKFIE